MRVPGSGLARFLFVWEERRRGIRTVTMSVADRVFEQIAPLAEGHGFELVTCEIVGPKGSPVVRVYLDREGGIDLDAITDANAWISEALESDSPMDGPFVLEVSSPGLERPLRTPHDYQRFTGQRVTVKTRRPIDGQRRFTGGLAGIENEDVIVECEGERRVIPLDAIAKANLKPEIDFGEE